MPSPDPNAPTCPDKFNLLKEYVAAFSAHNEHIREYSKTVNFGANREILAVLEKPVEESREPDIPARKRTATCTNTAARFSFSHNAKKKRFILVRMGMSRQWISKFAPLPSWKM